MSKKKKNIFVVLISGGDQNFALENETEHEQKCIITLA